MRRSPLRTRREGRPARLVSTGGRASVRTVLVALALVASVAAGCSDDGEDAPTPDTLGAVAPGSELDYLATLHRTGNGVAHVIGDDLGDLGYGTGWAAAEDHACTLAEAVVSAKGQRARWFGPGDRGSNVDSDVAMAEMGVAERGRAAVQELTPQAEELMAGYLSGIRGWYDATDPDELAAACPVGSVLAGIEVADLLSVQYRLALAADLDLLTTMATAAPPEVGAEEPVSPEPGGGGGADQGAPEPGAAEGPGSAASGQDLEGEGAADDAGDTEGVLVTVGPAVPTPPGGTAWAIGSEMTESGLGALGTQPLLDWDGVTRLWEHHLRMVPPSEAGDGSGEDGDAEVALDVYGASFVGVPVPVVGFTRSLAFSPAPSPSPRGSAHLLALLEGDPTSHVVDGAPEVLDRKEHTVEVLVDGEVVTEVRSTWRSRFGPIVEPDGFGWTDGSALAWNDVALDTPPMVNALLDLATSTDVAEATEGLGRGGAPAWAATVLATAEGVTWYGDTAATPKLSDETKAAFEASAADPAIARAAREGLVVLDGTTAMKPGEDRPAPLEEAPSTERRDYVVGVGSGSWLANPEEPALDGHRTRRAEPRALALSDRQSLLVLRSMLDASQETGGRLALISIQEALLGETDLTADLLFDRVLSRCRSARRVEVPEGTFASGAVRPAREVEMAPVCTALSRWARNFTLESRSALLWRLFMDRFDPTELTTVGEVFDIEFRQADPLGTPRGLAPRRPGEPDPIVVALAEAFLELEAMGAQPDGWLRDTQWVERGGERIPMHGGGPGRGSLSGVTIAPGEGGAVVTGGPSYLLTVLFTDAGPVAEALLSYGQSDRVDAITHADQTYRYSDRAWRPVAFTEEEILADPALTSHELIGEAPAS